MVYCGCIMTQYNGQPVTIRMLPARNRIDKRLAYKHVRTKTISEPLVVNWIRFIFILHLDPDPFFFTLN